MSAASTLVTNVPLRGWTATRFSSASRLTASRSGVRPIPSSLISSSSRSSVPGGRRSVTMRSRISSYARSAISPSTAATRSIPQLRPPPGHVLLQLASAPPSSSGGSSYASSVSRQIFSARAAASRPPLRDQRSKFSVEDSSGR